MNSFGNIHPTAVIGGAAQWRGKETTYPVVIHPTATVGPLCQIDAGCERATTVGANTQVMGMVHIGHGVQIGKNCDIASGTTIAGEVTIGNNVRIGVGVSIPPYKTIGDFSRVGAGAVVVKDVPPYECWAGNPAKKLYSFCRGCGEKIGTEDLCTNCIWENALNRSEEYRQMMEEA